MGPHEKAAAATVKAAEARGAHLPASLVAGILGLGRSWDALEADPEASQYPVPNLARQVREYTEAIAGLTPPELPDDPWAQVSTSVGNKPRTGSRN